MFVDDMAAMFGSGLEGDAKEALRQDMEEVGPEDAARYFRRAEGILEGYAVAAEPLDPCMYAVVADAWSRAREARLIAEGYASS